MSVPARPEAVPPDAEYLAERNQWAEGPRVDGKRHGRWRFWRAEGSLQEETDYQQDVEHGRSVRYHPDGSLSVEEQIDQGRSVELMLHRTDKPTDELKLKLPSVIRRLHMRYEEGWQNFIQFLGDTGQPLTQAGEPAPARPASIPEGAYLTDTADAWKTGLFNSQGAFKGLHRYWTLQGELGVVRYHSGRRTTVGSRLPDVQPDGNPLIHAAAEGDTAAVEALLSLGFGHEPGAALHAALEGQLELAKRLLALPPGEPFHPLGANTRPERPKQLPTEAVWVPARKQWIAGRLDREQGPVGTWKLWTLTGEDADGAPRGRLQMVEYQGSRPRWQCDYRTLEEGGEKKEEAWFDEGGRRVRRRRYDPPEDFREDESLPSGGSIVRWGNLPERIWREERSDAQDALVSVRCFDDEGRLRTELLPVEGRGRVFDAQGTVVAEGGAAGKQLSGRWTLHPAGAEGREVDLSGFALAATAGVGTLLTLIHQVQASPVPPFLEKARDVKWEDFSSYFRMDPKRIFLLLRLIALDHPAAVQHGVDALGDDLYHQGTVSALAGPVLPFLCAIAANLENETALGRLLSFLAEVGTRDHNLNAANALKKAFRQRKGNTPAQAAEALEKAGFEPAHGPFLLALVDSVEAWVRLAGHANPTVSMAATSLLGLTDDARAASALCTRLEGPASSELHQAAARRLSLHAATDALRAALERALGSQDAFVRGEAAMSWLRLHLPERDRAVAELVAQVKAGHTEPAVVLTLLPARERVRHLGSLLQALSEADPGSVFGVARAALAIAFAQRVEGELSSSQREVLQTLLGNESFWRLNVNAAEVLGERGLPTRRTGVEALLRGEAAGAADEGGGILTVASGLGGPRVDSFREEEEG